MSYVFVHRMIYTETLQYCVSLWVQLARFSMKRIKPTVFLWVYNNIASHALCQQVLKQLSEKEYFVDENNPGGGAQWPDVLNKMKDPSKFIWWN